MKKFLDTLFETSDLMLDITGDMRARAAAFRMTGNEVMAEKMQDQASHIDVLMANLRDSYRKSLDAEVASINAALKDTIKAANPDPTFYQGTVGGRVTKY